jgi:glycosyltransferase involved in cell wall biosynthesis
MSSLPEPTYAIISPARNEEKFIEKTIKSMISQTILPVRWVIVSDGSTDQTDDIILRYSRQYSWITALHRPNSKVRDFASKVHSFNLGLKALKKDYYDFIGNLDADLTFSPKYFEYLISRFFQDPKLGVAGTPFVENGVQIYNYHFTNAAHVSGACQMFRRECFEEIGGYVPIEGGGIDWVAVTTARLKGWHTQTFMGMTLSHHRKIGTGNNRKIISAFNQGRKDYRLGNHPLWQLFRSIYQIKYKPYLISGFLVFLGYIYSTVTREKRSIPNELMSFARKEQMQRLKRKVFTKI